MDHPRLALPLPTRDPKAQGQERWDIHLSLQGGSSRTSPIEERLADALITIRSHGPVDLTFYTDGSATLGLMEGAVRLS